MVISIFKFLKDYYGVLLNSKTFLSHRMAKKKYKLVGCGFDYAERNLGLIKSGKIIYVRDTCGIVLPYICPEIINECVCTQTEEVKELAMDKSILEELECMPTYLVGELLSKYKSVPSFYKVIKKELICRGVYTNKIYKLKREIVEIELDDGRWNDKYQRRRKIKCKRT